MVAANAAVGYNTQKTRMQEEKIPQMKLFKKKDLFLLGALALSVFITIWKKNRRRRRDRFDYETSNF